MPEQKQGEPFVMKHRLAGAAVLIGFAVVVLPLLLGGPRETPQGDEPADRAGDSGTRVFRSNITPIGGATPQAGRDRDDLSRSVSQLLEAPAAATDQAPEANTAAPPDAGGGADSHAAPDTETVSDEAPQSAARDTAATTPSPPAPAGDQTVTRGWAVQVGTFRKPSNVEKLVAKLENSGFSASTTEIETDAGAATRVWIGPYQTRVEAARMKNRVTQHTHTGALIVAYP